MARSLLIVTYIMTYAATSVLAQRRAINPDITPLSSYIGELMNKTLGVSAVQEQVDQLHYERHIYNGSKFVDELANTMSQSMREHIDAVRGLKQAVEESIDDVTMTKWPPCCEYDETKLDFNDNFRTKVDRENMCEIIAPTAPASLVSVAPSLLKKMMRNRERLATIKWQYIATVQGVMTIYPALEIPKCSFIDPRFRPWYIETARSHRRNVLILLDVSRSMNDKYNSVPLINISRDAIKIVLETLTPTDMVGFVAFNNTPQRPEGCFKNDLALSTENNLETLEKHLEKIKPAGESVYTVGFHDAFQLLATSMARYNATDTGEWSVLFISDGRPKELYQNINDVYSTIKSGNHKIGNKVTIYAYGVGRNVDMDVLQKIATQSFDDVMMTSPQDNDIIRPRKGVAHHIDEPGMLRNTMTLFGGNYVSRNTTIEPTFSVPYVDGGGLGLIFTVGLPVSRADSTLFGVVAVDITVDDLFNIDTNYKGRNAYVFVIDGTGRVITHPLMPQPANHSDPPNFIQINQLERHPQFDDVMVSMVSGGRGQRTLTKQEILPVGDAVKITKVTVTYFWRPIEGANFSVCFVLKSNTYDVTLRPEDVTPAINSGTTFKYHRLDLQSDDRVCRHFYHKSTIAQTLVLFAPRSFVNHSLYPERETTSLTSAFTNMFNSLFEATSSADVTNVIRAEASTAGLFVDGVISDVMWTSLADVLWVNNTDLHVALRYVGTRNGVDRLYPGTTISGGFDVTTRIWYELAVANPGRSVMSPPYKDAAGAGNVVSMSHTIQVPSMTSQYHANQSNSDVVLGVMGVDFSLDFLFSKVQKLYPKCWSSPSSSDGWFCTLIDNQGNIILHNDYIKDNGELKVKHIASDESLMSLLRKFNFIKRRRCLDLDMKVYRYWYELDSSTRIDGTNNESGNDCAQYFMTSIPNTNIFFAARPDLQWCPDPECPQPESTCKNESRGGGSYDSSDWQCPCTDPVEIDTCANVINLDEGVPPCYPDRPTPQERSECIPEHLDQCFDPQCEFEDETNCSGLVGCNWCHQTHSGGKLAVPYCSQTELCYNGLQDYRLPGYASSSVCDVTQDAISTRDLIIICVCGCFVIVTSLSIVICCVKKRKRRKEKKKAEEMAEDSEHASVGDPSSPTCERVLTPTSPPGGNKGNVSPRKYSHAPQFIISVVDSDGSEILRKPVQLVQDGVTYGAPAPRRPSNDFEIRNKRTNATPLLDRTRDVTHENESFSSSNTESGIHSDEGRQRTSSGISEKSTRFRFDRSRSHDMRVTPLTKVQGRNHFERNNRVRRPWRSRDHVDASTPRTESPDTDSGYVPMRSASAADLTDDYDVTMVKSLQTTPNRRKSADDLLKSPSRTRIPHYVAQPTFNYSNMIFPHERHFSNPQYEASTEVDATRLSDKDQRHSPSKVEKEFQIFL